MLTDKDINKLMAVLATKQEVSEIKEDTEILRESVQGLITAVEQFTTPVEDLRSEYAAVSVQLSRHEKWLHKLAKKVGVKLIVE